MSPDHMDVLMLPYKLGNRKAEFVLSEMRLEDSPMKIINSQESSEEPSIAAEEE